MSTTARCEHLANPDFDAVPQSAQCDACVGLGDSWVHLRSCLVCGKVGCCDQSKNGHARAHWESSMHPVIQSIESGDHWRYCFEHKVVA